MGIFIGIISTLIIVVIVIVVIMVIKVIKKKNKVNKDSSGVLPKRGEMVSNSDNDPCSHYFYNSVVCGYKNHSGEFKL